MSGTCRDDDTDSNYSEVQKSPQFFDFLHKVLVTVWNNGELISSALRMECRG